jgi:stalled ribosome rescue protein Dom34
MAHRNSARSKHFSTAAAPGRYHALVWLDSRQARGTYVSMDDSEEGTVRRVDPPCQLHIEAARTSSKRAADVPSFYHNLAEACHKAKAVPLMGPSTAKEDFLRYLHQHSPATVELVSGAAGDAPSPTR